MPKLDGEALVKRLPAVRGRLEANAPLADLTWFRVGGPAEVLFTPQDETDLADFLRGVAKDIPVYVIGVGSNLLVRDGGVPGVVIRLGRGFSDIKVEPGHRVRVGTAVPDVRAARTSGTAVPTRTRLPGSTLMSENPRPRRMTTPGTPPSRTNRFEPTPMT